MIVLFTIPIDQIYGQEKSIDEFLDWPSETNYNSILIAIVVLIALSVLANYLWAKRKGRRYSEE